MPAMPRTWVLIPLVPAIGLGIGCGARNTLESGARPSGAGGASVTTTGTSTATGVSSSGADPCAATCQGGGCVLLSEQFGDADAIGLGQAILGDRLTGDIVVAGSFTGQLDLGLGPLPSSPGVESLFLARYDANGAALWTKAWHSTQGAGASPPPQVDQLVSVGADLLVIGPDANLVAAGCPGADPNARVVKLAADGTCLWARALSNAIGYRAAVDGNEDILLAGHGGPAPDLGCGPLALKDGTFVAKLRGSDGSCVWSHALTVTTGVPFLEAPPGLAVDASSAVDVGTVLLGSFTFAGQTLTSVSEHGDAALFKLDAEGNEVWARSWGSAAYPWTESWIDGVAITKDQRVWIAGAYNQGIIFGAQSFGQAPWSGFVAGLTPDGDLVSAVSLTSAVGSNQGQGTLLVDSTDALVTARAITTGKGPIEIGGDSVSGGPYLLAKLDPSAGLAPKWATAAAPGALFAATSMGVWSNTPLAIDGCDDILVTGFVSGDSNAPFYFARLGR